MKKKNPARYERQIKKGVASKKRKRKRLALKLRQAIYKTSNWFDAIKNPLYILTNNEMKALNKYQRRVGQLAGRCA